MTVLIHGKFSSNHSGTGTDRVQTNIWTVMNNVCNTNSCKIVCHSDGCYAVEYWLSNLGNTASGLGFSMKFILAELFFFL